MKDEKTEIRRRKEARLRQWGKIMDHARSSGQKFVPVHENPFLYDSDFRELVETEKAQHERKVKAEKEKKDKPPKKKDS